MRIVLLIIISLHGLIHFMGFVKAFQFAEIKELSLPISRSWGIVWLSALLLFLLTAVLYGIKSDWWWAAGVLGIILSQLLIIVFWQDAKFGTIPNLIILLACIIGFSGWMFEQQYRNDVREGLNRTNTLEEELLTEADLAPLPDLIQNYLRQVGVVGKPKVKNLKATFQVQMRAKGEDWFDMHSEQYNFFDQYERFYFLDATVKGLPTKGYHRYTDQQASMMIKLLSLIPVSNVQGPELFKAETVTFFNDMCIFAPAALIDPRIQWEPVDSLSVKAIVSNQGSTISAVLHFNEEGRLVDFSSHDRLDVSEMQQIKFTTPLSDFRKINGLMLPTYGEAIWHYPDGPFSYGKFKLLDLEYNVSDR